MKIRREKIEGVERILIDVTPEQAVYLKESIGDLSAKECSPLLCKLYCDLQTFIEHLRFS